MTCIVGMERDGKVYIGADSALVSGWTVRVSARPKVFRKGNLLIGFTGSIRTANVLEFDDTIYSNIKNTEDDEIFKELVDSFVPSLREAFKLAGILKIENSQEEFNWGFLIGVAGHLYSIENEFDIFKVASNFDAMGSSRDIALGVLQAQLLVSPNIDPKTAVINTLSITSDYSGAVTGPFHLEVN